MNSHMFTSTAKAEAFFRRKSKGTLIYLCSTHPSILYCFCFVIFTCDTTALINATETCINLWSIVIIRAHIRDHQAASMDQLKQEVPVPVTSKHSQNCKAQALLYGQPEDAPSTGYGLPRSHRVYPKRVTLAY